MGSIDLQNIFEFLISLVVALTVIFGFVLTYWHNITKVKVRAIIKEEFKDIMDGDLSKIRERIYQNSDDIREGQQQQVENTSNIRLLDSNLSNLEKIVANHYELHNKSFEKLDNRLSSIDNQLREFLKEIRVELKDK